MQSTSDDRDSAGRSSSVEESHETGKLSVDETFEVLKNNRRRLVLEYLHEAGGTVELSEIADHVTATENDTDVSSITSAERKRVYVGLYQFHLPKMADMGVIDYNRDRGEVTLTERGEKLYQEYERRQAPARRWYLAYLGIAGGGILAVGVSLWLYTAPVAIALLAFQTVILGCVALAQAYIERSGSVE
ncbi:MAG: hypothetical protein V5A55_07780 [Halovenus sp.]